MNTLKTLRHSPVKQAGLSLIELMIASVIGLFILAGAVTIFSSNSSSSSMSNGMARLQDSGRVALDIISNSVRMAGYSGCRSETKASPSQLAVGAPDYVLPDTAIWGSEYTAGGTWSPTRPAELANLTNRVREGTDVIYLQHGSGRTTFLATNMTSASDNLVLNNNPDIKSGELVVISDCTTADIFRASGVADDTAGNPVLTHAGGTVNSSGNLSKPYTGTADTQPLRVMGFNANAYFVGDTGRDNAAGEDIYSLFTLDTTAATIGTPTELIEGVENIQILYGETLPASGTVRYVSASNVSDWVNVASVQIGLLIATTDSAGNSNDTRTYNLAGTSIGSTGNGAHAGDRRLRASFNSTIQLRNRNLSLN